MSGPDSSVFRDTPGLRLGKQIQIGYLLSETPFSGDCPQAHGFISEAERRRSESFKSAIARAQFVLGRALMRIALSRLVDSSPTEIPIELTEDGKPYLAGDNPLALEFNLSHKPHCIAVGICRGFPLGIDVEAIDLERGNEKLAHRYFAPGEVDQLRGLETNTMAERFCRFWTLKEAYIKGRGKGLRIPLSEFAFGFDDPDLLEQAGPGIRIHFTSRIEDDPRSWQFHTKRLGETHLLSVAANRSGEARVELKVRRLDLDRLFAVTPGE